MRILWAIGLVTGLVVGAVVLWDVPLFVKLLVGLGIVVVGVAGPFGSVMLAGLLLGAGLLSFGGLLAASEPAAVGSALGVATLLTASGVAFSLRELFRNRTNAVVPASSPIESAGRGKSRREPVAARGQGPHEHSEGVSASLDELADRVTIANKGADDAEGAA